MLLKSTWAFTATAGIVLGCTCVEPSVRDKFDHADLVFRGTIIAFRDAQKPGNLSQEVGASDEKRVAVFRVQRVWKGEVGPTLEMPAVEEGGACVGFSRPFLKVGSDLLVYAHGSHSTEYYTSICGFHKPAKTANDFWILGPGGGPHKPKRIRDGLRPELRTRRTDGG